MKKLMTILLTIMMMFSLVSVVSADDEDDAATCNDETCEVVDENDEEVDVVEQTELTDSVSDENLLATTTYTLTFNANGGTVKDINTGYYVESYSLTRESGKYIIDTYSSTYDQVKRDNYDFLGWYTEKEGGDKITKYNQKIIKDTTVYAHWSERYNVTFDANGGKLKDDNGYSADKIVHNYSNNQSIGFEGTYNNLPTTTRDGYDFLGWYTEKEGGDKIDKYLKVIKNMTVYAQWSKRVTVTFDANGGKVKDTNGYYVDSIKYDYSNGSEIYDYDHNPSVKRDGYTFLGWYTAKTGGEEIVKYVTTVTKDTTIYARWKDSSITTLNMYRLYNKNSGEHFYTSNSVEKDALVKAGWKYEGVGWKAPSKSDYPVYRLYNQNGGEHHFTLDANERAVLIKAGWKDEGIGWYSADPDTDEVVALLREYNPNQFANNHNYTKDQNEHNTLIAAGWVDEGTAWNAIK